MKKGKINRMQARKLTPKKPLRYGSHPISKERFGLQRVACQKDVRAKMHHDVRTEVEATSGRPLTGINYLKHDHGTGKHTMYRMFPKANRLARRLAVRLTK